MTWNIFLWYRFNLDDWFNYDKHEYCQSFNWTFVSIYFCSKTAAIKCLILWQRSNIFVHRQHVLGHLVSQHSPVWINGLVPHCLNVEQLSSQQSPRLMYVCFQIPSIYFSLYHFGSLTSQFQLYVKICC